ncbi:MAG: hypothetical protein V8S12_03865 [Lachnospiraceae bacterium]
MEECRKECLEYEDVILVTTLAEVEDTAILEETLKTREGHEEVIRSLAEGSERSRMAGAGSFYRVL